MVIGYKWIGYNNKETMSNAQHKLPEPKEMP